jgi:hypothetical protein
VYLRARVTQESKEHGRHRVERAAMTHPAAQRAAVGTRALHPRSADYRTHVHRAPSPKDLAKLVAGLLQAPNPRLIVPPGIPASWLPDGVELLRDGPHRRAVPCSQRRSYQKSYLGKICGGRRANTGSRRQRSAVICTRTKHPARRKPVTYGYSQVTGLH